MKLPRRYAAWRADTYLRVDEPVRVLSFVAFVLRDELLPDVLLELLRVEVLLLLLLLVDELLELLRCDAAGMLLVVVVPDLRTLVVVDVVRAGCAVVFVG